MTRPWRWAAVGLSLTAALFAGTAAATWALLDEWDQALDVHADQP